jgi:hypothetical protein
MGPRISSRRSRVDRGVVGIAQHFDERLAEDRSRVVEQVQRAGDGETIIDGELAGLRPVPGHAAECQRPPHFRAKRPGDLIDRRRDRSRLIR